MLVFESWSAPRGCSRTHYWREPWNLKQQSAQWNSLLPQQKCRSISSPTTGFETGAKEDINAHVWELLILRVMWTMDVSPWWHAVSAQIQADRKRDLAIPISGEFNPDAETNLLLVFFFSVSGCIWPLIKSHLGKEREVGKHRILVFLSPYPLKYMSFTSQKLMWREYMAFYVQKRWVPKAVNYIILSYTA